MSGTHREAGGGLSMAEREGARKSSVPIVVCTAPDICKTPVGSSTPPLPYQIIANFQDSDAVSPNVRFGGDPAFLLDQSVITRVTGDEPGTAGGVRSGVNKSIAKPMEASKNVRANKKRVVRNNDAFEMNNGNTSGVCIYQSGSGPACAFDSTGKPTKYVNPPTQPNTPEELEAAKEGKGIWSKASPIVHGVLGVASFIPVVSVVAGALDAGIYAGEGNIEDAAWALGSIPPGGKVITTAGKIVKGVSNIGKAAKTVKAAEKVGQTARERKATDAIGQMGKQAKEAARTDGKVTIDAKKKYRRGKFRKGVRKKVWEDAEKKSKDGVVRDPVTGKEINGSDKWDMGHKPGYEHYKHVESAETRGLSRKEFLDEYNTASHYRPEMPSSNRSHAGELKTNNYFGP
jgi:hypothetical protein